MRGSAGGGRWPLLLRFGLALAVIVGLALFTMVASVMIADTARHDAAAINQAGSLRMQAYRIASEQQLGAGSEALGHSSQRFEEILNGPVLRRVMEKGGPVAARHATVLTSWEQGLRPALEGDQAARYHAQVGDFVAEVDAMVDALQRQAETRIQMLRLIQGGAIFMTLILVFVTMYLLHTGVVIPLRELRRAAYRASHGDLSVRAGHTGDDEIGELATAFNLMTGRLEDSRQRLEQQVTSKTAELANSNAALKLLYDTVRALTLGNHRDVDLQAMLRRLARIIDGGPVTLCLSQPGNESAFESTTTREDGKQPGFCQAPECHDCLHGEIHRPGAASRAGVAAIPLEHGDARYGVLLLEHPAGDIPAGWKLRLAEAMADQIAAACALTRDRRRQRRLALMEERAVIARELHDSLAQSLSYLKIQVARLQAAHRGRPAQDGTGPMLDDLREGLNTAYRHLRELLTTFRLKMNEPGLEPAMAATVAEFRARARNRLQVHLDMSPARRPLEANSEIHLLQITREALANIVNHAHASQAWIRLAPEPDGGLRLRIDDDGVGMGAEHSAATHHYGLAIMRERSHSMGGSVSFSERDGGGTRVEVDIPGPDRVRASEAIA